MNSLNTQRNGTEEPTDYATSAEVKENPDVPPVGYLVYAFLDFMVIALAGVLAAFILLYRFRSRVHAWEIKGTRLLRNCMRRTD
ncbi:MAG: hypothetical protein ACP5M4_05695 [Acidobacteriaceae bacterium]